VLLPPSFSSMLGHGPMMLCVMIRCAGGQWGAWAGAWAGSGGKAVGWVGKEEGGWVGGWVGWLVGWLVGGWAGGRHASAVLLMFPKEGWLVLGRRLSDTTRCEGKPHQLLVRGLGCCVVWWRVRVVVPGHDTWTTAPALVCSLGVKGSRAVFGANNCVGR
jgi:hypothetical protein